MSDSKVAVYLRVSTDDKQESGMQSQERAIRQYCKGHGIAKPRIFRDKQSGKDTNRPGFKKLQTAIFMGEVKTVIVWNLDRISRDVRKGMDALHSWLDKGVRVVSVSQEIDYSGLIGQTIAHFLFTLAQMQLEDIKKNIKRGLKNARAKGKVLGRPSKLDASDIKRRKDKGESVIAISEDLGVSRQTVYSALKRAG